MDFWPNACWCFMAIRVLNDFYYFIQHSSFFFLLCRVSLAAARFYVHLKWSTSSALSSISIQPRHSKSLRKLSKMNLILNTTALTQFHILSDTNGPLYVLDIACLLLTLCTFNTCFKLFSESSQVMYNYFSKSSLDNSNWLTHVCLKTRNLLQ